MVRSGPAVAEKQKPPPSATARTSAEASDSFHPRFELSLGYNLKPSTRLSPIQRTDELHLPKSARPHPDTLNRLKQFTLGLDRGGDNNLRLLELLQGLGSDVAHTRHNCSD